MAEEDQKQVETKEPEVKTDPWEERALAMGWNPDKYDKDSEEYIDAKEFVRRKPLFDKISDTTKRLKNVEETLTQLASHHQKVKEVEYQRALKELRLEKRAALKEGDTMVALELEDKMDQLAEQHQQEVAEIREQQQQPQQGPSNEFLSWVKDNDWYLKDEDMHDFADGAAAAYIQRAKIKGELLTEDSVFRHVLDKVKRAYPEKFENPNRQRASAVSSSERSGKPVKSTYKLSDEEEQVARNFEKSGIMSREKYIEERKRMQGEE